MEYNGKNITVKSNATTSDIINALEAAVPIAVKQVQSNSEKFPTPKGNPVIDAKQAAEFVRDNVKYKADGYLFQDIQLPTRMFAGTKKADCKSFALASVAQILAAGHRGGFRFASYKSNKIPTHVYFYVLDNSGKKHSFDPCIENLKESNKATNIIDMELRYMTGVETAQIGRRRRKDRPKSGRGKKVFLAPARGAFLTLVRLNVRGLATKLQQATSKSKKDVEEFWKKMGGSFNKLNETVNKGAKKKALFGKGKGIKSPYFMDNQGIMFTYGADFMPDNAISAEPATATAIATALAAASPILLAVSKLFKKKGIPEGEGDVLTEEEAKETEAIDPKGEGFEVADSETSAKTTPLPSTSSFSFKPSPVLIGGAVGAIALIYFLTSKKRR